jgi:hypothetical protein
LNLSLDIIKISKGIVRIFYDYLTTSSPVSPKPDFLPMTASITSLSFSIRARKVNRA